MEKKFNAAFYFQLIQNLGNYSWVVFDRQTYLD